MSLLDDSLTLGSGVICERPAHELRKASFDIAADFIEGRYENAPLAYLAYVQDEILNAIHEAVEDLSVESLAAFGRDRDLSAAADLDRDRATELLR